MTDSHSQLSKPTKGDGRGEGSLQLCYCVTMLLCYRHAGTLLYHDRVLSLTRTSPQTWYSISNVSGIHSFSVNLMVGTVTATVHAATERTSTFRQCTDSHTDSSVESYPSSLISTGQLLRSFFIVWVFGRIRGVSFLQTTRNS